MRNLIKGAHSKPKIFLALCIGLGVCALAGLGSLKILDMWRARQTIGGPYALASNTVVIPSALSAPQQKAHFFSANVPAPLIIDLHPWSSLLGSAAGDNGMRLDELAYRNSWSYIRPELTGHNRNPTGCCGKATIDAIKMAIDYARNHAQVTSVHVIGGSGGGYTALCGAMSGQLGGVTSYQAWVPITDLETWHRQRPGLSYERDILACTNSAARFNLAEARRRSPLFMSVPAQMPVVHLFAGVHDGTAGSSAGVVPISHSIRMYNRLSQQAPIADDILLRLMETRTGPQSSVDMRIDGRQIHLAAENSKASITIFEGGHEVLANAAMQIAIADEAKRQQAQPAAK
jgi:pimeloyl-ACP methyl ester carboxylesterase